MANKLFNSLNKSQGNNNLIQFMMQHKGKNPQAMITELVNSGKVSQEQLNQIQNYANKNMSKFNGLKSMFGFK